VKTVSEELAFLLSEQAEDRCREFEADQSSDSSQEDHSLEPNPSQVLCERRRLRHAAELAERAYQLAQNDEGR
jgi:hypothetical protein